MLELRELRYFVAVAEELNFSRAAERLHMAQPPVSAAIRKLERDLGTELLARTTREVSITPAGRQFLAGAYNVLRELERAVRETRSATGATATMARLAFCYGTRVETLPTLARRFAETFPTLSLMAEQMWNADIGPALRSGAIDAALCVCPEPGPDLLCETIRRERIMALLPARHSLAVEPEIDLRDLADETFFLLPREVAPTLHDTLIGLCRDARFEPHVRYGGTERGWELEIIDQLGLVSLAPASAASAAPSGVTAVHLGTPSELVPTALVSRAGDSSVTLAALRGIANTLFAAAESSAAALEREFHTQANEHDSGGAV